MKYTRLFKKNDILYGVLRTFNGEYFKKALDELGTADICAAYHCDKILKGTDNYYYLVDIIAEAEVIEYINDEVKQIENEK